MGKEVLRYWEKII